MKISKTQKVLNHLTSKKYITTWDAITLYRATRLAAIIFTLRKRGFEIVSNDLVKKDIDGSTIRYTKYVLIKPIQKGK